MDLRWIKAVFYVSAAYDGVLGIAVLFSWQRLYEYFGVTLPNHPAYVQFPALLVLIFAAMFYEIARAPLKNRHLILYGIALKASYSGVAFWHHVSNGIPSMWLPYAWADLGFLVVFVIAWMKLGQSKASLSN